METVTIIALCIVIALDFIFYRRLLTRLETLEDQRQALQKMFDNEQDESDTNYWYFSKRIDALRNDFGTVIEVSKKISRLEAQLNQFEQFCFDKNKGGIDPGNYKQKKS